MITRDALLGMRIRTCACARTRAFTKMAGTKKRKLEFDDLSSIREEAQSAIVHGRVAQLSPVKTSRKNEKLKYFDCKLTDGKEVFRTVSFEPKVHSELVEFIEKGQSVSFVNCDIKKSKIGSGYELVLSEKSSIIPSPKKIKVSDDFLEKNTSDVVTSLEKIDIIEDIAANVGNKVSIRWKVVSLKNSEKIKAKDRVFVKRECVFGDASKASRLDLVDSVEKSKCYTISNVVVKAYSWQKYFSTTDNSEVKEISDIGEVCEY